ncbi:YjbF family lipoprotein [uncultured Paraglaciecola sp.]|uniref:YjbF family lipoprotein n=1 Tax=uncultured Paraglaciecola sp. TaxID=1765024 RepID=UPI0025D904D7|nr:YjbF family lipoprotein [uncultured Paraglaciecola sp.]
MNVKTFGLSALILIFTSACSGTYHAYYQTLKIAFSDKSDAKMTLVEVQQSSVDVISVRRGERPSVIMALAYIENGQHKWVSSDKAMFVIDKGRLIRTIGLNKNLLYSSSTDIDPLKSLPHKTMYVSQKQKWIRTVDQTDDEYGYSIESTFNDAIQDSVQALNLDIETILYVENIIYKVPTDYIRISKNWKNYYWYAKSGEMIKSIQMTSPLSEALEITYLSRIARLNQ